MDGKRLIIRTLLVTGCLCLCGYDLNSFGEYNGLLLVMGVILVAYSVGLNVMWSV